MNSLLFSQQKVSKRSLTFNKSFIISIAIHSILIFGISITTYYKLPILMNHQLLM